MLVRSSPVTVTAPTTPATPTGANNTLDELYGCVYGGRPDYLTGANVPVLASSKLTLGAQHDGGLLPGMTGQHDWDSCATKQDWPTDATWPSIPYSNTWGHGWLRSAENRAWLDFTDPQFYFGSTLQGYPSNNTNIWTSWIQGPLFAFKPDGVTKSRSATTGGTPFWSIDMSSSTPSNKYFIHWASDEYDSRMYVPPGTIISVQWWARMRAKAGVDPTTINMLAGGAGDRYNSPTDPGGGANPAWGIPRYKRLPTDGSWRLMGYTTQTSALLLSSPPPIIAVPL